MQRYHGMGGVAAALTILVAAARAEVGGFRWEAGLGPAYGEGEVQYAIGRWVRAGGKTESLPFPISRLEFPTRAIRAEGWLRAQVGRAWELWMRGGHTLTEDAGTIRDSDWEYPEENPVLAIYSESDAIYSAWSLEGGVRWWFWRRPRPGGQEWSAAVGAGWARDSHAWEARDGVQTYPAIPDVPPDTWEGVAVTYDVTTDLPFAEVVLGLSQPTVRIEGRAFLSPVARVRDRDDHLGRGILAEADAGGVGGGVELAVRYQLSPRWHLMASVRWWAFEVEGDSKNLVYGEGDEDAQPGERWVIHQEIRGDGVFVSLGIGATW